MTIHQLAVEHELELGGVAEPAMCGRNICQQRVVGSNHDDEARVDEEIIGR